MSDETYLGVKIEKLPTVGEAYSMKTVAQGRRRSLKEEVIDERKEAQKKMLRRDEHTWIPNAKRVLAFDKASTGQKKVAQDFLKTKKPSANYYRIAKILQGVVKTISKQHKDF